MKSKITMEEAKKKAANTYNAAADFYDDPANTFWERYGRRTVERLRLSHEDRILDVCCGSGASAIPAAEIVNPGGSVLGVDLAGISSNSPAAKRNNVASTTSSFNPVT